MKICVFVLFSIATALSLQRFSFDVDTLRELDAWELRLLHDFVRGKGRGSVSRLNIEDVLKEKAEAPRGDESDLFSFGAQKSSPPSTFLLPTSILAPPEYANDLEKMRSAGAFKDRGGGPKLISSFPSASSPSVKRRIQKLSTPHKSHAAVSEEPNKETFKQLAELLQTFIDRRKSFVPSTTTEITTTTSSSRSVGGLKPIRISSIGKNGNGRIEKNGQPEPQQTSAIGSWQPMDPSDVGFDEEQFIIRSSSTPPEDDEQWESKMKNISSQLSHILFEIKRAKTKGESSKPHETTVTIVRNGSAEQTADGRYKFVSTITLVQSDGLNILVDTGLGTDINARTKILERLNELNVAPPQVHIVVTTHGHADHSGGLHDFPDATHYNGWYSHQQNLFNLTALFESDRQRLTKDVELIRSPGHTSEDIALIVHNERTKGAVFISGDTFIRREDVSYPMMWQPLSWNQTEQEQSRRRACTVRWVVPGHGPPFEVDAEIRRGLRC